MLFTERTLINSETWHTLDVGNFLRREEVGRIFKRKGIMIIIIKCPLNNLNGQILDFKMIKIQNKVGFPNFAVVLICF